MRAYLSYAMTGATQEDRRLVERVRIRLKAYPHLRWYDPERDEPPGMTLPAIQEFDFEAMKDCEGLLVVWGPSTCSSSGVGAELEWARRVFGIPAVIYWPQDGSKIPAWSQVTANFEIYRELKTAVERLEELMSRNQAEVQLTT